jgi:hypothetical protein
MKFNFLHFLIPLLLVAASCSTSKVASEDTQNANLGDNVTAMELAEAEEKLVLIKTMFETKEASAVKSNFAEGVDVSGYTEPMASMVIDAAAKQAPPIESMKITEIEKSDDQIKVIVKIEKNSTSTDSKAEHGDRYFILNNSFEFVELHLFDAGVQAK